VIDFTKLKPLVESVLAEYDHKYLNELKDFAKLNPTAENIAYLLHKKINRKLDSIRNVKVSVWESPRTGACYY